MKDKTERLEAELRGYRELCRLSNALIAGMLKGLGASESDPVVVKKAELEAALELDRAAAVYDGEKGEYRLFWRE